MLNLRKILRKLTLRKTAEEPAYTRSTNIPYDMLKRVRNGIVHDKYLAQAHLEYLQREWRLGYLAAIKKHDSAKAEELLDKIEKYKIENNYSYSKLRSELKNDEYWPHPQDRDLDEDASIIEREKQRYTLDDVEEAEQKFRQKALNLEKEQTYLMLYKLIDDSFKKNQLVRNGRAFYDAEHFKDHTGEDVPSTVKISGDDYTYAISSLAEALMESDDFLKRYARVKDRTTSNADPLDIFSSYIDKITPSLFQQYLNQEVIPEIINEPVSLDETVTDEFGREAPLGEQLYNPKDTSDIESGAGLKDIKIDIAGDLAGIEKRAGMPLEEYVGTEMFQAHALLRQLISKWKKEIASVPYKEKTTEDIARRIKYQNKLDQSIKNVWNIKNLDDLSNFVTVEDLLLLQEDQGSDATDIQDIFQKVRGSWADKLRNADKVLHSPNSSDEDKIKSREIIERYENKLENSKGKGSFAQDTEALNKFVSVEDVQDLPEFKPIFEEISNNKETNLREILWTYMTEPRGYSPTYYNSYFQDAYKDILEHKPEGVSFTDYFYDIADTERSKDLSLPENSSNSIKILNDLAMTEKEVKKPLHAYVNSPEFIVQATLQEFRSLWNQIIANIEKKAATGEELSSEDKEKIVFYKEKLSASAGITTIKTPEELSNIIDENDIKLLGNRTFSDIKESIASQSELYLKHILWDNSNNKENMSFSAYSRQAERLIDAKPPGDNFIQFYTNTVAENAAEDTSSSYVSPEEIGSTLRPATEEPAFYAPPADIKENDKGTEELEEALEMPEEAPEEILEIPEDDPDKRGALCLRRRKVSLSLR